MELQLINPCRNNSLFELLPNELLHNVFSFVFPTNAFSNLCLVSRRWAEVGGVVLKNRESAKKIDKNLVEKYIADNNFLPAIHFAHQLCEYDRCTIKTSILKKTIENKNIDSTLDAIAITSYTPPLDWDLDETIKLLQANKIIPILRSLLKAYSGALSCYKQNFAPLFERCLKKILRQNISLNQSPEFLIGKKLGTLALKQGIHLNYGSGHTKLNLIEEIKNKNISFIDAYKLAIPIPLDNPYWGVVKDYFISNYRHDCLKLALYLIRRNSPLRFNAAELCRAVKSFAAVNKYVSRRHVSLYSLRDLLWDILKSRKWEKKDRNKIFGLISNINFSNIKRPKTKASFRKFWLDVALTSYSTGLEVPHQNWISNKPDIQAIFAKNRLKISRRDDFQSCLEAYAFIKKLYNGKTNDYLTDAISNIKNALLDLTAFELFKNNITNVHKYYIDALIACKNYNKARQLAFRDPVKEQMFHTRIDIAEIQDEKEEYKEDDFAASSLSGTDSEE